MSYSCKKHVIKYCEKVYERSGKNLFWLIKNSGEILDKLKARDFNATSLSTYDFSTLYTTLPHNLIKDKLIDLIENTFQREGSPYLACSDRNAFFTSEKPKKYHAWSCQNVRDALTFLLDNIFIRFGTKLYRQVVGIPMGTNCAPLVADLFLFCCERDFMMSLSDDKQADVIDAFNSTSRYLDDILNINNVYFDNMVSQIYPSELQLNKANASDTEAAFLDLHLSISNDIVSTKIYDKRDDFDFEIVNFPFLDGDVPRSTSYGVYISQLIRFARASSYVADFNTRNKLLTQKLLKQGYRYHKLRDGRGLMLWLFVGPTGVYLLDFFCSGIQFNLLLSNLSLLYLLVISWFICFRRWCIDKLGVFHANQIGMNALRVAFCNTFDFLCVLIHIWIKGEVGAVKPV